MEEEIICNRWKDLADESILHRRSFLAFGNSGYMISSTESLAWRHAGSQSLGSHVSLSHCYLHHCCGGQATPGR